MSNLLDHVDRGLDLRVAVDIFGWKKLISPKVFPVNQRPEVWAPDEVYILKHGHLFPTYGNINPSILVPAYTMRLEDALKVVRAVEWNIPAHLLPETPGEIVAAAYEWWESGTMSAVSPRAQHITEEE